MSYTFNNKVAIITGSSRGIGRAVAEALASEGASVVLNGRNSAQLNDTLSEFREVGYTCQAIAGDISYYDFCESLVRKTIEHYGKLDILINNAGISAEGNIEESHPATFRSSFEVNVLGVIYPAKAAIPHLKKTKGSIVFTGSVAGFIGLPGFAAYSGSKMALTAITKSLRIELAASDIHVGLNYVGFAENDVDKTFINKYGEVEKLPIRSGFKKMSMNRIAQIFLTGIRKRRKIQVLSGLGKLTYLSSRLMPGLLEYFMTRRYIKQQ